MITRRALFSLIGGAVLLVRERAALAQPRREEVALFETPVADYRFHEGPRIESSLRIGEALRLVREPSNTYDAGAVAIHRTSGEKLGYVPWHLNSIPGRLIDGGVPLAARISAIQERPVPPWKRMRVRIVVVNAEALSQRNAER